ncbi:pilus assembly protein [Asticcacaulis sp. BYS171W]|uniref:Pilus assembly protein n=1 Tax=Asticcacaulis aquaticus TaxID=2984212 RepID=A0ABT5HYK0_9CAUL|nr:TadE/TadG family type IV pilus assembly protein [Asticcacaulis aquaticus]MDC7685154.1 pilus assembly protein [Asticcacaulis aquaticus]
MISLSRLANRLKLKTFTQAFSEARGGAAAVEFALIAPILIVLYLGLAELTLGMMASRRTSHLAATVGDLAAQSESLTDANVSDIFDIGTSMLQPFTTTGTVLKIRLSCVKMSTANKAEVQWSDGRNLTKYANNYVLTNITTTQLPQGESLIVTEVEYAYTSPFTQFLPSISTFKDTYYHHPRTGTTVTRKAS